MVKLKWLRINRINHEKIYIIISQIFINIHIIFILYFYKSTTQKIKSSDLNDFYYREDFKHKILIKIKCLKTLGENLTNILQNL